MALSRTFVAVPLPDAVCRALTRLQRDLGAAPPGLRWSDLRQAHLTLVFFGDLDAASRRRVVAACAVTATAAAPIRLALARLGAFPTPRAARVVWAGVGEGHGALIALHAALVSALDAAGVAHEQRPLAPHVTLARARRGADACALAAAGVAWRGPSWTLSELEVRVSRATPRGHVHRVVARCVLGDIHVLS